MLKNIILSLRPHFWILSIIPALSGAYLANNHAIAWREFLLIAVLIGPCISGVAEIVNDYADRETDTLQNVKRIWKLPFSGGSGVVRVGGITKNETIATTVIFSAIAFAIAFSLNWKIVVLTTIGLFIALEYSLKPLHFKIRGFIGPLTFASGFRGLISFHIGWLTFAGADAVSLLIALFFSLLFFSTFSTAHLADYEEDKKLRINTFPVKTGFKFAKLAMASSLVCGIALLPIFKFTNLVAINCLVFPWLAISLIFLWKMLAFNGNRLDASKLGLLAIVAVCTAPLMFF